MERHGEPVLVGRGLEKLYRMGEVEVWALRGVDVSFRAGEFVVLLGPSGSGKSTLLNLLGGLDVPTSGTIAYLGHELTGRRVEPAPRGRERGRLIAMMRFARESLASDRSSDPSGDEAALTRYRREHVGFVFQFYNLIPSLTARENVALVTDIATSPMAPEEALRLVGLGHRLDHFPAQLSGGEQQRVAIARAVAKRPSLLLCDEPTGALDIETGKLVLEALASVNRDLGTTTVVITHNAEIARMADRVISIADGRIAEERRNEHRASPSELRW